MTNSFEILKFELNNLVDEIERCKFSRSNATVEGMLQKLNSMSPDQLQIVNELIILVEGAFKECPGTENQETVLRKSQQGFMESDFEAFEDNEESLSMDLLTKFINFLENAQGHNKQSVERFADAILNLPQSADSYTMQPVKLEYLFNNISLANLQQFFMVGFIIRSFSKHPSRPTTFEGSNFGGMSSGYPQPGYSSSAMVFNQKTNLVKLIEWFRSYGHELKRKFDTEVKRIESAKPGYWERMKGNAFSPKEIYQKGIAELELDQTQYSIAKMGMKLIDKMVEESRNQTVFSPIPTTGPMQVLYPSGHQNFYPSQQPFSITSNQPKPMTAFSIEQQYYQHPARADPPKVSSCSQDKTVSDLLTQLETVRKAIPVTGIAEFHSTEPEHSPICEPQPELICQEEQLRRAKLREEQELFEKQLAAKKDNNKRTEVYMKEEKLRSDEKAELEFNEARDRQHKKHQEDLRRIQEEIEEYEKETQRLLQDRIREWKACTDAFFACLHLKQLFNEKEKEWSKWLSSLGEAIKELKTRWELFEKIVKNLTKNESSYDRIFRQELIALHKAAQCAYESLFDACTTVKNLFGKFPDGVFLCILHGKLVVATNKLCNILDQIDHCLENPDSIHPIRDSFMNLKQSEIPSTGQLRRWSKEQSSVYHGIEEPRVYRAQTPVEIHEITSEGSGGNNRYETSF
ncbi:hypothetical protein CAEBREN_05332 [Caenorhabditis brenneri]|uniref:Uncharacterized protein n=1 Tax=Caenorhabditis brenneri TaxID=135651 RepID=G0NWD5_CAEBE|nr:hypothetical protein CAEBREN_05332 [Caenorhabditis brenneri]